MGVDLLWALALIVTVPISSWKKTGIMGEKMGPSPETARTRQRGEKRVSIMSKKVSFQIEFWTWVLGSSCMYNNYCWLAEERDIRGYEHWAS